MTDTKWRSPNGHSIASDVTDKLPPYTHPENVHTETPNYIHIGDDLLSRIEKMLYVVPDKGGCFKSLHDLGMWISRAEAALIKRALAQQQTVGEYLTQSKCGIHNKYNAFRKTDFGTVQVFCPDCE